MGIIYPNPIQAGDFSCIFYEHKAGVLAFMHNFRILFDNKLAERDVRTNRVQHKVSGCFRTLNDAHILCALRSYVSTARILGLNAIDAIYKAFPDQPFIPSDFSCPSTVTRLPICDHIQCQETFPAAFVLGFHRQQPQIGQTLAPFSPCPVEPSWLPFLSYGVSVRWFYLNPTTFVQYS